MRKPMQCSQTTQTPGSLQLIYLLCKGPLLKGRRLTAIVIRTSATNLGQATRDHLSSKTRELPLSTVSTSNFLSRILQMDKVYQLGHITRSNSNLSLLHRSIPFLDISNRFRARWGFQAFHLFDFLNQRLQLHRVRQPEHTSLTSKLPHPPLNSKFNSTCFNNNSSNNKYLPSRCQARSNTATQNPKLLPPESI